MCDRHHFIFFIKLISQHPQPHPEHTLLPSDIKAFAVLTSEYKATILTAFVKFDCCNAVSNLPQAFPIALSIQHCHADVTGK
jgi:hypothetical protein